MIMLLWILPFLAPKRPAVEYCSRCRCEMKQGRRVPTRARTLPMGDVIHCSPSTKGVHSAVRINGKPISRPKGHIRSSSAHQVLTMRAIADRGMSRTSTELPAGKRSPKLSAITSAKAAKQLAPGTGGASFNAPFVNSKPSKRMTLPKVSSSPSLQLFRDAKAACGSSMKKNSFDSDVSASSGKDLSTGSIGSNSSIGKDATPSKMTLVSSTLNAAFDASVAVPVKAAKSSLASAGKASLASANKASMRLTNFAKLQRMNPMAPSPVATPAAVDMPAGILSSSSAMTLSSSAATTISAATMSLSASGQETLSESPTSILPEAAKVASSWGPFVDVVPPTPQMFSQGTFDGPVAPGLMGFARSGDVGFATSSTASNLAYAQSFVSLHERQDTGRSLYVDGGDAGSKRYSI
ncbi:hypothetical protein K523DRAFT_294981 [Schizophyllum commune Tattone D]|nr:hypothetical protein K523DRAFT_294981 [Schizophyllum commune Tattone D]